MFHLHAPRRICSGRAELTGIFGSDRPSGICDSPSWDREWNWLRFVAAWHPRPFSYCLISLIEILM